MNAILAERIRNAAQVVLEYGGISFALDEAECATLIAALRSNDLQANINRGLSLVADLERLGTIDSAVSAELQIALGGGYQPSPLPEDERTAHKTELG